MSYIPVVASPQGLIDANFNFDVIAYGLIPANVVSDVVGQFSVGSFLITQKPLTFTGIKFYQATATPCTVRATLWSIGSPGLVIAQVDVPTAGVGIYTATFGVPYVSPDYTAYKLSVVDISAGTKHYTRFVDMLGAITPNAPTTPPMAAGPAFIVMNYGAYSAGDAYPSAAAAGERYPVEPTFTVP